MSWPFTAKPIGRLYQPARSGCLSGVTLATCGGVLSYLNPKVATALEFPARSLHVPVVETAFVSGPA